MDSYRELQDRGDKLNKDQLEAIAKYDAVILNLEFARELQKQFVIIQGEVRLLIYVNMFVIDVLKINIVLVMRWPYCEIQNLYISLS